MSYRKERFQQFNTAALKAHPAFADLQSEEELRDLFMEVLQNAMHGLCFSAYGNDQQPGDQISGVLVERRINIMKTYAKAVRSFSCIDGNELIPQIAYKHGMKTLVGAWLGDDLEKNESEIEGLIHLAKHGFVDIAAVGNEVLYRKDLTEEQLLEYIRRVKEAIPDVPVGYVDAYYEFVQRPSLVEASDVILCNLYPYWEGTPFEYSLPHMISMYESVKQVAGGKQIIISETGWPSQGKSLGGAQPSKVNAMKYFINTHLWALDEGIDVFYFASFDEGWKIHYEGDVGAFWGIWDKHENLKY